MVMQIKLIVVVVVVAPEQSIQDHEIDILYYKNTSLNSLPG